MFVKKVSFSFQLDLVEFHAESHVLPGDLHLQIEFLLIAPRLAEILQAAEHCARRRSNQHEGLRFLHEFSDSRSDFLLVEVPWLSCERVLQREV